MVRSAAALVLVALLIVGGTSPAPAQSLRSEAFASGLVRPVLVTAPTGDPDRLFVVEKRGVIRVVDDGVLLPTPFLDIESIVDDSSNEEGLLGLEFDPDYWTNGYFYVYYVRTTGSRYSQISRFSVTSNPDSANPASELKIFEAVQPFSNHNGGHIEFSPLDGYLYFGTGDGGSFNDPGNRAQNGLSPLGKMLRFDVDGDDFPADPARNYRIPPSNPFVGNAAFLDEIWSYGLRNPYRWSFDEATADLYIGDVGQNCWEELDWQAASSAGGENYGWKIREGTRCFNPADAFNCNNTSTCAAGLVPPYHEFNHSQDGFSCSVTGGRVYNGSDMPALAGTYFYADYCSNQIYSLRYDGASMSEFTQRTGELNPPIGGGSLGSIVAVGRDGLGELYLVKDASSGTTIFKIVPDPADVDTPVVAPAARFQMSGGTPNPFTSATRFDVSLEGRTALQVDVYDAAGRRVRTLHRGDASGTVAVEWNGLGADGRRAPAGVYFVRAAARDWTESRRVTLLR